MRMYSGDPVAEIEAQYLAAYNSNFLRPNENPVEPASVLVYPVMKRVDLEDMFEATLYDSASHTIEATISGIFYW